MNIQREVATKKADRPHQFEGVRGACGACGGRLRDERHAQWSRVQSASRVTAVEGMLPRIEG